MSAVRRGAGDDPVARAVATSSPGTGTLAQLIAAYHDGPVAIGRLRTRIRQDRNLSAGYLGLGFALLGALVFVRGLASLGWSWSDGPARWLSLVAWAVLAVAFAGVVLTGRRRGGVLPARVAALLEVAGLFAVIADLLAFLAGGSGAPFYPTAVIGFGACLLACLPLQSLRRSVIGAVVLAASGCATVAIGWIADPASLSAGITGLLLGLTPVVAGITMIHAADRYLGRRIEQAVTESLITAPAVGLGVTAASELRRLDGDAERLLAEVAALQPGQHIDAATAARAEQLSDELRQALVTDHEQTWLQIALTESEHLRRTVRVIDPALLAARLEPEQRGNLLALTWLCVAHAAAPALDLTFLPAGEHTAPTVVFSLVGTHRRGIDPAVWPLFARLGRHTVDLAADRALVMVELP